MLNRKLLLIIAVASLCLAACGTDGRKTVIFDTDMGNDVDDALALQMLLNYQKEGIVELKGITVSKGNPNALAYVDGFCRFNGFENIPLGFGYNGKNAGPEQDNYLTPVLNAEYGGQKLLEPQRTVETGVPEAYLALRQMLADSRDGSVSLIATGPLQNIALLLDSAPDNISNLSGVDLVRKKVEGLYLMGGEFKTHKPEWNVLQDIPAAQTVFSKCPVRIVASGGEVGSSIRYPHQSILEDFGDPDSNPLTLSYLLYSPMPYDLECWDLTTVIDAVEQDETLLKRSERGTITVDDKGVTLFTPDPKGMHQILKTVSHSLASAALVQRVTLFSDVQRKITVTAHAGSCGTPANSMESIEKAVELGVDVVEMDIRHCPDDGSLALKHDRIGCGEQAAALREALLVVKPTKCQINLDIKESQVFPDLYRLLVELDMVDRVFMTGVLPEDIFAAKTQMPGVPLYPSFEPSTKLITDPDYVKSMLDFLKATGSEGINCNYSHVTEELSAILRGAGLKLSVWTVDSEEEMSRIIACKPTNITTRHPDTVRGMLN